MKTFVVTREFIGIETYEVNAEDEQDAVALVDDGAGTFLGSEYSHMPDDPNTQVIGRKTRWHISRVSQPLAAVSEELSSKGVGHISHIVAWDAAEDGEERDYEVIGVLLSLDKPVSTLTDEEKESLEDLAIGVSDWRGKMRVEDLRSNMTPLPWHFNTHGEDDPGDALRLRLADGWTLQGEWLDALGCTGHDFPVDTF